ncbi:hypothetical protein G7Y89_g4436 [Cudoniella acicularis]|uniref:Uncharacterized protein n=1 Tax=Cudoniella acicularis TaxID=354080 RepID=A0A8H4RQS8_9HELO|nr:hypothetical protein G7Y89_g4436 [Cudoniella acicularis]
MSIACSFDAHDLAQSFGPLVTEPIKRKPVPGNGEARFPKIQCELVAEPITGKENPTAKATMTPSITALDENPKSTYPRLKKPIVIPSVLNHTSNSGIVGLPFVRGYAVCLGQDYDISLIDFLAFIDELNIRNRGHLALSYISKVGSAVHTIGHFDPTRITALVGKGIVVAGMAARWASINGPLSRKKDFLSLANKEIFNPKGLRVEIVDSKDLRKFLGLAKDDPLIAPLQSYWTVPSLEQMKKKQRAKVRVPHRLILGLLPHVHDITLHGDMSGKPTPEDASKLRKKAEREVVGWLCSSEINMEAARGKALLKLREANKTPTEKEKEKLMKASRKADKEAKAVAKAHWIVIRPLIA